ncbi:hypothetical protein, partial [Comamonas aquatica]
MGGKHPWIAHDWTAAEVELSFAPVDADGCYAAITVLQARCRKGCSLLYSSHSQKSKMQFCEVGSYLG